MPRPQRIEYKNACYHVINRGRGRQTIFNDERYYMAFLTTLAEAHQRFSCIIHAYCLIGNHYHLLIETPNANLSRVMRHINGVYTQRYNRLRKTDGPLFRGRFKSILVDQDAYLLQLSRYIHRHPIDMKKPLVTELADYPWSSYPAYINQAPTPDWLFTKKTYQMLGHKQRFRGYKDYVSQNVDEETLSFYNRGNQASIVGDSDFKDWVFSELLPELEAEDKASVINTTVPMDKLVMAVADYYKTTATDIRKVVKGPQKGNEARKVAMYLCQEIAGGTLTEIAEHFGLGHRGSVSFITHQVRKMRREDDQFNKKVELLIRYVMKQVT